MPSICHPGAFYALLGLLGLMDYAMVMGQQNPVQTCPPMAEISPCSCNVKKNGLNILCEATDVNHINRAMGTLKGKNPIIFYLKLRHNSLPKLQGFVFLALDIRHLTIHNSSLAVIEETALSSLGEELTQLDVSQNQLQNVPSLAIKNLHHLLILNLNHNRISQIHNKAFEGLDTLEILTLYENKINVVEAEAFRGLEKKLKRLNLAGNELTSVPQKSLAILDMLKKLEIQENKIKVIREGDFEGMKNLDSLILAHNQLTSVPANVFQYLTLLSSLELEGNNIAYVDKDPFAGLEVCRIYGFIGGLTGTASIATLTAISVDRYNVVVYPLEPLRSTTRLRSKIMVFIVWCYRLIFSIIPALNIGFSKYVPEGYLTSCSFDYLDKTIKARIFMFVFFIFAWLIPFTIITYCYVYILKVVRSSRDIRSSMNKHKTDIKLSMVVIGVILLWFVAWTPYAIVPLLGISGNEEKISPLGSMIPAVFCKASACLNPYVYSISHQRFRKEFGRLFYHRDDISKVRSSYFQCNPTGNPSIIRKPTLSEIEVVDSSKYRKNKFETQALSFDNKIECETELRRCKTKNDVVFGETYPMNVLNVVKE